MWKMGVSSLYLPLFSTSKADASYFYTTKKRSQPSIWALIIWHTKRPGTEVWFRRFRLNFAKIPRLYQGLPAWAWPNCITCCAAVMKLRSYLHLPSKCSIFMPFNIWGACRHSRKAGSMFRLQSDLSEQSHLISE